MLIAGTTNLMKDASLFEDWIFAILLRMIQSVL